MDMLIFILLMLLAFAILRRVDSLIYFIGVVDISLRIIHYLKVQIPVSEVSNFVNKYIPASIPSMIAKYSTGIFYEILMWVYVIAMIIFVVYLIRSMFNKR